MVLKCQKESYVSTDVDPAEFRTECRLLPCQGCAKCSCVPRPTALRLINGKHNCGLTECMRRVHEPALRRPQLSPVNGALPTKSRVCAHSMVPPSFIRAGSENFQAFVSMPKYTTQVPLAQEIS